MTRRLTGNTLILLINNMGSAGLAFLISVIIGRGLGPEGLGQYAFIMAWLAPLITLADFGMGSLVTRDVAQHPEIALPTLHTATRALLPIAGSLLLVAWIAAPLLQLKPPVLIALLICALLIILDPWYGLYTALFRAFQQMWPILIVNVGGLALQLGLSWLAVQSGQGLIGIAVVLIAVNVLQLLATWRFWRTYNPLPKTDYPAPTMRHVLKRAWPFALAAVLNALQLRLNVLLLEHASGDVSVGLYSAASRFVEAARLVPGAFFGALFPTLASLVALPAAMRRTFLRALWMLLAFSVTFALAMTLFGGWLIRLTYDPRGTAFVGAETVLTLLAWSLTPSLLRALLTLYLYSLGQEQFVNMVTLIALVVQAGVGWLLIRQWGAAGAAISVGVIEGGTAVWLGIRALRSGLR
jgi:O-antigen/teichoic acid export membrane protein